MDARIMRAAILTTVACCLGASYRTTNFVVQAPDARFAQQVGDAAEMYRRDLAIEWLGHELSRWSQPCPITVLVGRHLGAGGATSFMFQDGSPFGWRMSIQGSACRVLDSVLPHEITHTIFATHFGQPLPRWADEGACTTVEHREERSKQEKLLLEFLTTNRGIAFNQMFAMTEYPPDILPLYAQGYSLARYLIALGGKQKFVQYVGDGMRKGNWTSATQQYYGFWDLSQLQVTWLDWVRNGSQPLPLQGPDSLAEKHNIIPPQDHNVLATHSEPRGDFNDLVPVPPPTGGTETFVSSTKHYQEGWYPRQRELAPTTANGLDVSTSRRHRYREEVTLALNPSSPAKSLARPQMPQTSGEQVIEWGPVSVITPAERQSVTARLDTPRNADFLHYDSIPRHRLKLHEDSTVWR